VDLDAHCVKPFDFNLPNIFAPFGSNFTNRVLCLEDNSPSLKAMIEFVQTPNPTKPWRGPRLHRRDAQRVEAGERWGIEALGLDCSGDPCFSHFLKKWKRPFGFAQRNVLSIIVQRSLEVAFARSLN